MKYIVSWMLNDVVFTEEYASYPIALARQIQLDAYGLNPTLHEK